MRKNRDNKQPLDFSVNFPGGASHVIYSIVRAAHIERESGLYLRDLFTGGCVAASAGSFPAVAAFVTNPEDPTKPLFAMDEFVDVFASKLPLYLPHRPYHHKKHIVNHLTKHVGGSINLHLDPKPMENDLKEMLAGMTISDACRTLSITSQEINPYWRPHDFTKVQQGLLEPTAAEDMDYPVQDLPLYKALMAATRFPSVFDSYYIEETGSAHIDIAFADGGADFIAKCIKHKKAGQRFGHVVLGTTVDTLPLTQEQYRSMDGVDMLRQQFFIKAGGFQVRGRSNAALRAVLGERNFYVFEDSLVASDYKEGTKMPSLNILDTRLETTQEHIAFAREQIERRYDQYARLIDRLVENHARLAEVKPDTAFTAFTKGNAAKTDITTAAKEQAKPHSPRKAHNRPRTLRLGPLQISISFGRAHDAELYHPHDPAERPEHGKTPPLSRREKHRQEHERETDENINAQDAINNNSDSIDHENEPTMLEDLSVPATGDIENLEPQCPDCPQKDRPSKERRKKFRLGGKDPAP